MTASNPARRKCSATSKRSGRPCQAWAIAGGTVCHTHGGAAKQVRQAAGRRLQEIRLRAEAAATLDRLGVAIETTPIEALEAMLWEAAGNVAVLRAMVADLEQVYGDMYHESGSPTGEAKPHVLYLMYAAERDRLAKLAEACAKLGLDERRIRLAEVQVDRLYQAVTKALAAIPADHAATFRTALAGQLRALTA